MLVFEMGLDGAMSSAFHDRSFLIRASNAAGDADTAKKFGNQKISIPAAEVRRIRNDALIEGSAWAVEIEKKCKSVLRDVLKSRGNGFSISQADVGRQLFDVIMSGVEAVTDVSETYSSSLERYAKKKTKAQKARDLESLRTQRRNKREWAKQQKQLADWRAGQSKPAKDKTAKDREPTWRLKARQGVTRMRTGWNRWHNNRTLASGLADDVVKAFIFTLGNAKQHTKKCLARAGMVMRKNDPRWADSIPPLHVGCKSTLIKLTAAMMKKWGVKLNRPRAVSRNPADPGFGG